MDFLNLFAPDGPGPWLIVGVCFLAIFFQWRRGNKVADQRLEDAKQNTREMVDALNQNSAAVNALTEVIKAGQR